MPHPRGRDEVAALVDHTLLKPEATQRDVTALVAQAAELGVYAVSDGGTSPYRVHVREPSFVNLQSLVPMVRGGLVADLIASIASVDPIMGGVDR